MNSLGNNSCALELMNRHRYRRSQSIGGRLCTKKAVVSKCLSCYQFIISMRQYICFQLYFDGTNYPVVSV